MFAEAVRYEQQHSDGRTYTWTQGETLIQLLERKNQIIVDHEKSMAKQRNKNPQQSLSEVLANVLDDDDGSLPCLACHL